MFLKWYLKASHNLGIFYVLLRSILTIVTTNKSCKSVLLAMSMKQEISSISQDPQCQSHSDIVKKCNNYSIFVCL